MTTTTTKKRVLLVDDHAIVRRGLASLIAAQGDMEVCGEADSVAAAKAQLIATRPDLAVVDMSLAEGDGLEVLQWMRREQPEVLAVVLSMFDENVYAERALRAGARGYVRKLDTPETIIRALRQVLAGEVYVSEKVAAVVLQQLAGVKRAPTGAASEKLTDREVQVLRMIGSGMSNHAIAEKLFISVKTVEAHREHIKRRLGLAGAEELLKYAIEFSRV